ncbi:MAG: MarR family winged helix-turn-helix transcriptional regulator [Acidimicrobiales bacterium]|jgi:DNA-binding MarR family transcriptional regulator
MPCVRWLDPDEQRTWRSFLTATRLLFYQLDHELQRDAGMPHGYYEILVRLSEATDCTLRMSELADATLSSRSRLSHAVQRLEESGLVVRRSCPSDGRGALATLTSQGIAALRAAAPGHVAGVRAHLFDQLGPGQAMQLREICEAIIAHLDIRSAGGPA